MAIRGKSSATAATDRQLGTVAEVVEETARTRSIALEIKGWSGHRAGRLGPGRSPGADIAPPC